MPEEGITGPTMIIKYNRTDVENALIEAGQELLDTEFVLTGRFFDPSIGNISSFKGVDTIKEVLLK